MSDLYEPIIEDIALALTAEGVGFAAAVPRLRAALAPHLRKAWDDGRAVGHLDAREGRNTARNPYTIQEQP